jgi:hypothetical protein
MRLFGLRVVKENILKTHVVHAFDSMFHSPSLCKCVVDANDCALD